METAIVTKDGVQGANAKKVESKIETPNRPNVDLKEKGNENGKKEEVKDAPKSEQPKVEVKAGDSATTSTAAPATTEPAQKTELKLEHKLRTVQTLHRISQQRMNLLARIAELESFEVAQASDADELEANPYQGCKLIIRDDRNREFVTNTPNLIRLVTQFIYDACQTKKKELESKIVFPA